MNQFLKGLDRKIANRSLELLLGSSVALFVGILSIVHFAKAVSPLFFVLLPLLVMAFLVLNLYAILIPRR